MAKLRIIWADAVARYVDSLPDYYPGTDGSIFIHVDFLPPPGTLIQLPPPPGVEMLSVYVADEPPTIYADNPVPPGWLYGSYEIPVQPQPLGETLSDFLARVGP